MRERNSLFSYFYSGSPDGEAGVMQTENSILIKKYSNRRLYNTIASTYITISDVADLIKAGHKIVVRDAETDEDMTAIVLTQIIMNKAKKDEGLLPVSLLHLVIQFGENLLHEFFEKYLEKTMESYLMYKKTMDDQVNAYLDMGMDFSNLADKTMKDMESLNLFYETFKKRDNDKK